MIVALALSALAQEPPPEPPPPDEAPQEEPAPEEVPAEPNPELEALKEQLAAQQEALEAQQLALEELHAQLTETRLQLIEPDDMKVGIEGHYRVRGYVFNHLFESQGTGDDYRDARYLDQRLWLRPTFDYRDLAKAKVELRALEDVVFGDNVSNASTALFAADPSATALDGLDEPTVRVSRAWMEFSVPVGLLRIGRQPSQWGMGLLANDGEGFHHHFGESRFGSTNDRLLFATKPIAIFEAATGRDDSGIPLIAAVAVDRLVEDPLIQFYGYTCTPGVLESDAVYDRRCDFDGDGVTDLDHGYDDDTRTAERRGPDWWADQDDDVWEMVYVLAYNGESIDYLGGNGDLNAGVWVVDRRQQETASKALIVDGYLKAAVHGVLLEGEVISITADTRALAALPDDDAADPIRKEADLFGYVVRGGYGRPTWRVQLETGFASGDDRVDDASFTGRPLHPDHNVGLLIYEEILSRVTAAAWTESVRGLWSNGGVYNSRYVFPTVHLYPLDNWELLAGFVHVAPHKPDSAIIRCKTSDGAVCDTPEASQPEAEAIGWELDFGIKHTWHEHLKFALEAGTAQVTDRVSLSAAGLNPEGKFFTVQSRIAYEF